MITKERLEELIEQCATVYMARTYTEGIYLMPDNFEVNDKELVFKYKIYAVPLEDLFETEEDAKWFAEFGCIERTERLELPTWEEDVRKDILFSASGGIRYVFMNKIKTGYSIEKQNPYIIRIQKIGECDNFIDYEYTKENYTLACRKAKELFLGLGEKK